MTPSKTGAGRGSLRGDLVAAIDRVSDGFVVLDRRGQVRYVNESAARLVRREVADLEGKGIWAELPSGVGLTLRLRSREAMTTQRDLVEEYVDLRGTWCAVHLYPSSDGITLVLLDVTDLRDLIVARRTLLNRLFEAEDRERARIAANVHDDSLQALGALTLGLRVLRRHLASPSPQVTSLLTSLDDQVGAATDRLRSLLFSLEPTVSDAPVAERIRLQADTVFAGSSTRWSVDDVDGGAELEEAERTAVLRITKEALLNIQAHASASEVTVTIRGDADGQEVAIADNGVGGQTASFTSSAGHRGLATMRDRAAAIGGRCTVEPSTPVGCTVRVYVPRLPPLPGMRTRPFGPSDAPDPVGWSDPGAPRDELARAPGWLAAPSRPVPVAHPGPPAEVSLTRAIRDCEGD